VLPTSQQLQSAAVNQYSTEHAELTLPASSTTGAAHLASTLPQVTQAAGISTANVTVPTSEFTSQAATNSWLYGDTPSASTNTLLTEAISSLVSIGAGLPLLSKKLVRQIKAGEFVNFSDLPPAKARPPAVLDTSQMSILGLLQLHEVESQKKLIPDFLTWAQCFAVYTAVLGTDQPQRLPELMAYQFELAKYARKYRWPSWVVYDINYRQEAAARPSLSWAEAAGHREAKFFSQCFTGMAKDPNEAWCRTCQSLDHSTSNCPMSPQQKIPRREGQGGESPHIKKLPQICRNYNSKGCDYPKCHRRHVCLRCGAKHPQSKCVHSAADGKS